MPKSLQTGLVAYADGPTTVVRPTQDHEEVKTTLNALTPTVAPPPATRSTPRCPRSARATRRARRRRSCCSPTARPRPGRTRPRSRRRPRASACRSTRSPSAPPSGTLQLGGQILNVAPDPEALAQVAQLSGGRAFTAEDSDALDGVYQTLGSRIGTKKEKKEISAGFAAAGLLLLGGAAFTSLRWRGRLP